MILAAYLAFVLIDDVVHCLYRRLQGIVSFAIYIPESSDQSTQVNGHPDQPFWEVCYLFRPSSKLFRSWLNTSRNRPGSLACSSPGCRPTPASKSFCAKRNSLSWSACIASGRDASSQGLKSMKRKNPAFLNRESEVLSYMWKREPNIDQRTHEFWYLTPAISNICVAKSLLNLSRCCDNLTKDDTKFLSSSIVVPIAIDIPEGL